QAALAGLAVSDTDRSEGAGAGQNPTDPRAN
ncbi:MAG: exonuclease, partial [Burkholderia sp.]|nr:exonuclease [Burkholderia sp.]